MITKGSHCPICQTPMYRHPSTHRPRCPNMEKHMEATRLRAAAARKEREAAKRQLIQKN